VVSDRRLRFAVLFFCLLLFVSRNHPSDRGDVDKVSRKRKQMKSNCCGDKIKCLDKVEMCICGSQILT